MKTLNRLLPLLLALHYACVAPRVTLTEREEMVQKAQQQLASDVAVFNNYPNRPVPDGPFDSTNNLKFLQKNIPLFTCSDSAVNRVYNYRWWMISKHLKNHFDSLDHKNYWVITEFFGVKPWASRSGAIPCPAGHQFYDVRWLRDPKYLRGYADYFLKGSAAYLPQRENANFLTYVSRPESHHFSSWLLDGVAAFLKVHPDTAWLRSTLPGMEYHQRIWDSLFTVKNTRSSTHGMYKIMDLYDGMEFSLSAVLGLIASEGPYSLYTPETWKEYYLGWETTSKAAQSDAAVKYPSAFHSGYPNFYLVRPSINAYAYGNLKALADLHRLANPTAKEHMYYTKKATRLQKQVMEMLWNPDEHFFYTRTAGDNRYGIHDYEAPVRESVGYTPWYFHLIPYQEGDKYATAWEVLGKQHGFMHEKGMTTAERQHPYYNEEAYAWNGRGWPFQNSVVFKAFANYLRDYKTTPTADDKNLLFTLLQQLVLLHGTDELSIGEWYIPSTGTRFGGEKDYFHSSFPDMVIADLVGFKATHENQFTLYPLLPSGTWKEFFLGNLTYHGRNIDILWRQRKNKRAKLYVWIDGNPLIKGSTIDGPVNIRLP